MVQYESTLTSTSCALLFILPNKPGQQNTQRKFALKSKYRPSTSLMLSLIKIEDQVLPTRVTAKKKALGKRTKLVEKEKCSRQKEKNRSRQNNKARAERKESLRQKEMAHSKKKKYRDCEP